VELAVVQAAERNREFVADPAPEGEPLGEAHVVRLRGLASANEAGSRSHIFEMLLVAKPTGLPEWENALVNAAGGRFLRIRFHSSTILFLRRRPNCGTAGD
jgi:hypothetical protein